MTRPGYAEAISLLQGRFRKSGATLPALVAAMIEHNGGSKKLESVRIFQRLRRLAEDGLVKYVAFAPEFSRKERLEGKNSRGRSPSGKWALTARGVDYAPARLSIEIANKIATEIRSTPSEAMHVTAIGTPTLLLVNCGPLRKDVHGRRLLMEGPTMGFTRPAQETALQIWAQNPRVAADWKALRTLRERFPMDRSRPFTAPEYVALKAWPPPVRRAHRRTEKHRVIICAEVNPAHWDNLPIDRLEQMGSEYARHQRIRRARRKAFERAELAKLASRGSAVLDGPQWRPARAKQEGVASEATRPS
ncbi:MAG: hypothetical protein L3K19_05945 [Thermoplasmata archaeon]|nr:hypothetical protein [Thermoplasmata archaeon]